MIEEKRRGDGVMELKDKLLELRKKNLLSQQELADQLNVSRQSISKWELGETQPDLTNIIALSDIYHVSTDYLLKDISESSDSPKDKSQIIIIITSFITLMGLITGRILWSEYQNAISLLVGIIIQIVGVGIFECYAIYKHHKETQKLFLCVNIWLITLLPIYYFVEYTTTYQLIYYKLLQPILIGQLGCLLTMYIPIIISLGLSAILFYLIRKFY